jgi:hypothetical protein
MKFKSAINPELDGRKKKNQTNVTPGEGMMNQRGVFGDEGRRALSLCYNLSAPKKKTQQPQIVVGHSREALLGSRDEMRLDACVPMNGVREQGVRGAGRL